MKIPIWYCGNNVELDLPDSCQVDLYDLPEKRLSVLGEDHWINSGAIPADLSQFLDASQALLVIVNDHYRPTPTAKVLKAIIGRIRLESTTFLVATGLHEIEHEHTLSAIFGEVYPTIKDRVRVHSAYNEADLATFGSGERQVRLNSLIERSDSILIIGSVEPHYFAGFTGGRKIILPGCASFADVARNHSAALSPQSQPLVTRGNPVWDDIHVHTACLDYKRRYAIQLVTDHNHAIFHLATGDWDAAYNSACDFVKARYSHSVAEPYDAIISVVYPPLDRNLYQLQKSYENVAASVKDGGSILLISGCLEGVGDRRFIRIAEDAANGDDSYDPGVMLMGIHKIKRTETLARRIKLTLVSRLAPETLRYLPIKPAADIPSAVHGVIDNYGINCRIAVVLDSASQVLRRADQGEIRKTPFNWENRYA